MANHIRGGAFGDSDMKLNPEIEPLAFYKYSRKSSDKAVLVAPGKDLREKYDATTHQEVISRSELFEPGVSYVVKSLNDGDDDGLIVYRGIAPTFRTGTEESLVRQDQTALNDVVTQLSTRYFENVVKDKDTQIASLRQDNERLLALEKDLREKISRTERELQDKIRQYDLEVWKNNFMEQQRDIIKKELKREVRDETALNDSVGLSSGLETLLNAIVPPLTNYLFNPNKQQQPMPTGQYRQYTDKAQFVEESEDIPNDSNS